MDICWARILFGFGIGIPLGHSSCGQENRQEDGTDLGWPNGSSFGILSNVDGLDGKGNLRSWRSLWPEMNIQRCVLFRIKLKLNWREIIIFEVLFRECEQSIFLYTIMTAIFAPPQKWEKGKVTFYEQYIF